MILLLLGRSGCGKSTIEDLLISRRGYRKVITCTTRKRRDGEPEDSYHFMTKDEFLIRLGNGDFVEWDRYGDNFYGTLKESLEGDGMLVCAITPEGAANIRKVFPNAFVVHVKTDMKTSVMRAVGRETMMEESDPTGNMWVISNERKINGAVTMLYEDKLHSLAESMGTDLYILPSSIHEVIAVSTETGRPEELAQMVSETNRHEVRPGERLSNQVYHYSRNMRTITSVANTGHRVMDEP